MGFYWPSFLLVSQLMLTLQALPSDVSRQRLRRQAVADYTGLWPNGEIVYTLSKRLERDVRTRAAITRAITHWEDRTCLRFIYKDIDSLGHTQQYIMFKGGYQCSSSVGMGIGPQVIEISRSCSYTAMIIHEIGHAVGLWHEHCRRDRDAHVLVLWKNIKDNSKHNFDMQPTARLVTPYDLYSIMHYEPRMFSKNNKLTLRTLDSRLLSLVGRHSSLSHYDIKTISLLYNCSARCPPSAFCENDGFMTSSCTCKCPRGLTGQRCHLVDTDEGCGGVVHAEDGMVLTSHPNIPSTSRRERRCVWLLKGPPNSIITLKLSSVNLNTNSYGSCTDEIEVRYHSIGVPEGYAICKNNKSDSNHRFESVDNKIMLHFDTDSMNPMGGFNATIRVRPQKDCESSPCQHGGECEDVTAINTYVCHCKDGWLGKDCRLQIVDGGWSSWSPWSECIARCGHSTRRRYCTNPEPAYGGKTCQGTVYQTRRCDNVNCHGFFSCDFGTQRHPDRCGLVPEDSHISPLEWSVTSGKTPSPKTGPESGHTTGDRGDMYMFLEASHGQKWHRAISWYTVREPAGWYCLEFYYSLFGGHIGTLAVIRRGKANTNRYATLWQHSGNEGNEWKVGRISIYLRPGIQIGFVAVRGTTYQGDIAVDDISLSPGKCRNWRRTSSGCSHNGVRVDRGQFVAQRVGCTAKTCYCNQDGYVDCPPGPTQDVCGKNRVSRKRRRTYKDLRSG